MSLEEKKTIVRKMVEASNTKDLTVIDAVLDELMAPDFVMQIHTQLTQGWEVNKKVIEDEIKSFPDLHVTIEDIIAEGDKICVRLKETATHRRIPWISPYW